MIAFKNIRASMVFVITLSVMVYFASGASGVFAQDASSSELSNSATPTLEPESCGALGQQCCEKKSPNQLSPGTCNSDDLIAQLTKKDESKTPLPWDYPSYGNADYDCTCGVAESLSSKVVDSILYKATELAGASSPQMCNRYFDKDNYARIVDPGLNASLFRWPPVFSDPKRILPDDVVKHLEGEQKACLDCVTSLGLYTSIGCVPTEIESLIKLIVTVGLILAGALALVCIVVAGIKIQLSRGDSSKVSKAQDQAKQCVMGIVIIVFSAFIVNLFGGGLFGFSLLSPAKRDFKSDADISCSRECIFSEEHSGQTFCYRGACPKNNPDCGKTIPGQSDNLNNGCIYAPTCNNFEKVACPVMAPIPSPEPTPPTTVTPPPGTITPPPTKPTVQPTPGPVIGGTTLVTAAMMDGIRAYHQELQKNCGVTVTKSEINDCATKMNSEPVGWDDATEVIRWEMSNLGEAYLQCVGYMKGIVALMADARYISWNFRDAAKNMPENTDLVVTFNKDATKELRFKFYAKDVGVIPQPGDLVKFTGGDYAKYGHVGIVSEVRGDGFYMLDANAGDDGKLGSAFVDFKTAEIRGYYRLTSKK